MLCSAPPPRHELEVALEVEKTRRLQLVGTLQVGVGGHAAWAHMHARAQGISLDWCVALGQAPTISHTCPTNDPQDLSHCLCPCAAHFCTAVPQTLFLTHVPPVPVQQKLGTEIDQLLAAVVHANGRGSEESHTVLQEKVEGLADLLQQLLEQGVRGAEIVQQVRQNYEIC